MNDATGARDEEGTTEELVRLSRKIVCSIWERAAKGLPLEEGQGRILDVLREHGEYRSAWEIGDVLVDSQYTVKGVNPFLHVHLHLIVERQLREGDPPQLKDLFADLSKRGIGRHDITHAVGAVLLDEMGEAMRERRPFSRERYLKGLQTLTTVEK
jgi:hypothetical protein